MYGQILLFEFRDLRHLSFRKIPSRQRGLLLRQPDFLCGADLMPRTQIRDFRPFLIDLRRQLSRRYDNHVSDTDTQASWLARVLVSVKSQVPNHLNPVVGRGEIMDIST